MGSRAIRAGCCAALAAGALLAGAAPASAAPKNLFGVNAVPPPTAAQLGKMSAGGVKVVRVNVIWNSIEPAPGVRNWQAMDQLVANAALSGVQLLPFLFGTPAWVSPNGQAPPIYTPQARAAWTSFVSSLTARYGSSGSFWSTYPTVPRLPIKAWQVWNEVNLRFYWGSRPSPKGYRDLLKLTASALRAGDPAAKVVTAGVLPFKSVGVGSVAGPRFLERVFKDRRLRKIVDAVGVHPYGKAPRVTMKGIESVREALTAVRAKEPIWVTEFGWSTGGELWNVSPVKASPRSQAKWVRQTYRLMKKRAKALRLQRALYFNYSDFDEAGIDYWSTRMGLFGLDGIAKPAWYAYTRQSGGVP
jgi:hypothetical protein